MFNKTLQEHHQCLKCFPGSRTFEPAYHPADIPQNKIRWRLPGTREGVAVSYKT